MSDAPLPGSRFSLVVKLTVLASTIQLANFGLLFWAAEATEGETASTRVLVFAAIMIPPIFVIHFLGRFIVHRLTFPLMEAYERVAAGDFTAQLPPMTAGSEFIRFREAFSSMARALDRLTNELRQADLERRRLFADLAHELATPTSTLLGIAHALRAGEGDTKRLLDHLEHESARLERLIADVREVAHLEDPALPMLVEECDVGDLAARAVERARVADDGKTELRCDAVAVPAELDPIRIDQVLVNLINNAVRHAKGGTVAVIVRPDGGDVRVRIEDSGAGVPDELLPDLGRRLLRVDASRSRDTGGHGLGLSIVRAIVARHGGDVTFERASLGGLAAEVRLPAQCAR